MMTAEMVETLVRRVGDEIERLGCRRVLVLSTAGHRAHAALVAEGIGSKAAGIFDRAVPHVPIETALATRSEVRRLNADAVVAIGGGSTTGLAKTIALALALPVVAIPTTYAGSEMTPIFGLTAGGVKRTARDAKVLPKVVIYERPSR
jgi:maleylacetate reductase